jgi:hypothetical protein
LVLGHSQTCTRMLWSKFSLSAVVAAEALIVLVAAALEA